MKKIFILLVLLFCISGFCACGSDSKAENTSSKNTDTASDMQSVLPGAELLEPVNETSDFNELKSEAEKYIEKDVSALKSAIGEPDSMNYAPSCIGSGEDGELLYDGFTVITYKDGDSEKVLDVR